jgi:hypothetical protein
MTHQCWECGAVFAVPSELVVHRRTEHSDAGGPSRLAGTANPRRRTYRCPLCGMRFPTPDRLALHNLDPASHARPGLGRPALG